MKVTIDLNYDIMLAIGAGMANKCAHDWFDGNISDCNQSISQCEIKMLYKYAFADGMQHLMKLIENKDTE